MKSVDRVATWFDNYAREPRIKPMQLVSAALHAFELMPGCRL